MLSQIRIDKRVQAGVPFEIYKFHSLLMTNQFELYKLFVLSAKLLAICI